MHKKGREGNRRTAGEGEAIKPSSKGAERHLAIGLVVHQFAHEVHVIQRHDIFAGGGYACMRIIAHTAKLREYDPGV